MASLLWFFAGAVIVHVFDIPGSVIALCWVLWFWHTWRHASQQVDEATARHALWDRQEAQYKAKAAVAARQAAEMAHRDS